MAEPGMTAAVAALWRRSLGPAAGLALSPAPASGNNRVFVVRADGVTAIAKWYCDRGPGRRDRLDAEWRLLTYAAAAGIACVPRPLARDDGAGLALHSHCPGTRPGPEDIGPAQVDAAAAFFRALNRPEFAAAAADLPEAAEAAFSAAAQFAILERRLDALSAIAPSEARTLVARLIRHWQELRPRLERELAGLGRDLGTPLPAGERCVSPSDFGFHNALLDAGGALAFVDFEYAGWDDPAKAICDFLLQPAVPLDPRHHDRFVAAVLAGRPDSARLAARARLMLPLFALKWCCIMLNPFLPAAARPAAGDDPAQHRRRQLAKAEAAFDSLLRR